MQMTNMERSLDIALYTLGSPFGDRIYREDIRVQAEVDQMLELYTEGLTQYQRDLAEMQAHPGDGLAFYRTATLGRLRINYIVHTRGSYDNVRPVIDELISNCDITEVLTGKIGDTVLFNLYGDGENIGLLTDRYVKVPRTEEDEVYRNMIDLFKTAR